VELPQPGFLQGVKDLAHRHGALFILDEMRSGFHMALGGAQEYYNVIPDLATFSKAMSNGYEISALAGRRDVLAGVSQTHVSSTFYTNSIAMAAAAATVERLKRGDVIPHLWRLGQRLLDGLDGLIWDTGVEARTLGAPPMPYLLFTYDTAGRSFDVGQTGKPAEWQKGTRYETAWRTFYTETTRGGVLFHPNHHWFVSAAHTDADVDHTLEVCGNAFAAVRRAL
jgi:glutamate-1-semialdehyde 2,1-aminomutase